MLRLEVLRQRLPRVLSEAGAEAAHVELAERLQAFVVLGLAVRVQGQDLAEGQSAEAALEGLLVVRVLVEVVEVVVGRQFDEVFSLDWTMVTLEREVGGLVRLAGRGHCKKGNNHQVGEASTVESAWLPTREWSRVQSQQHQIIQNCSVIAISK